MLDAEQGRALVEQTLGMSHADEVQVQVASLETTHLRFARPLAVRVLRQELPVGLARVDSRRIAPILFFRQLRQALARGCHQRAVRMRGDELLV